MKKILLVTSVLCAGFLLAADKPVKKLTIDEAREQVAAVIESPEKMGDVMKQLSADDQKVFLVEVNKAIAGMPGSNESKTAKFLVVEREALLGASKGNLQPLIATMFSTVPLEALTVLAERYGDDLFSRTADSSKTFTDEQFTEIASSTVGEVKKSCEGLPDAAPRDVLAIYLFERATNWSIPDLEDRLLSIAISDPQLREVAKNEWLAAAKSGQTEEDRFSALLGYAESGRAPNVDVTLRIAGPQIISAMLADLANGVTDSNGNRVYPITVGEHPTERGTVTPGAADQANDNLSSNRPVTTDPNAPWNPNTSRSNVDEKSEKSNNPGGSHPGGYGYQD